MILDGKQMATLRKKRLTAYIQSEKEAGREKKLAILLVGDSAPSELYAQSVQRVAASIGMEAVLCRFADGTPQAEIMAAVDDLNRRVDITGILPLLPMPKAYDASKIINALSPDKDVDGFHPVSVGRLWLGEKGFVSCTPAGIIQLLKYSGIEIAGKECVVVGRSNIVGKPMAALLLRENGTVTVAHSKTENLKEVTRRADILIAAVGRPKMITAEYIKEGAVVIDVGIHRDTNNHLCGDVDFEDVYSKVSAITPVPGGVGPMTIAMLMDNCVQTARD